MQLSYIDLVLRVLTLTVGGTCNVDNNTPIHRRLPVLADSHLVFVSFLKRVLSAFGHRLANAPHPVRSAKLNVSPRCLVVRWETTGEQDVLNASLFFWFLRFSFLSFFLSFVFSSLSLFSQIEAVSEFCLSCATNTKASLFFSFPSSLVRLLV